MTRRLVVLRHAKSAYPSGVADHDRPLAPRGVADAAAAGRWLREHVGLPDRVVVSSALRAQQTWALAASALGPPMPSPDDAAGPQGDVRELSVVTEPAVYEAWAATLLALVQALPDEAGTVLLVGHNPGCENLVDLLAGEREPAAAARLDEKYPTAGIAVLEHDGAWAGLGEGTARLTDFAVPRG